MYRLSSQDYRDILDLIDVSNSCRELTGMQESILHAVQMVFRIERANFILVDCRSEDLNINSIVHLGIDNSYAEAYRQYYCHHDPFRTKQALRKIVTRTGEICPYSRWINLEYYNDFIKPQNIYHEMAILLRSATKLLGVIALFRSKRQPSFSPREVLKAYILAPHIATALENIALLSKTVEERNLLSNVSESFLHGVLLLDHKFQPIYYNSKAKDSCLCLCYGQPPQTGREGEEHFPIPSEIIQDCMALKEIFQGRNQIAPPRRQRLMHGRENRKFQVESSLVRQPLENMSSPCFLVSLQDLSKAFEMQEEALKAKHNLTSREIDIMRCVAQGLTNEEVARKLWLSRFTVENHLKHIFEKTGVRNRTELAAHPALAWILTDMGSE